MSETKRDFPLRSIFLMILVVFVIPFLPMIVSNIWNWWQAWAYGLGAVLAFIVSRALAAKRHPDILAERSRSIELQGAKSWDKTLAPLMGLGSVVILIVAGLDKRFSWTIPFSLTVNLVGFIILILGFIFSSWALMENRFFSGVVRIQHDRNHHVVTTGPYRLIRHPGYAGALWSYLVMPFLLDSVWALIPTALLIGVVILRTSLEDETLQNELPGYKEYAEKTKYRLLPGIW